VKKLPSLINDHQLIILLLDYFILKEKFMKAVILTQYGPPDVLKLVEIEKPTPQENEILVEVHATSVGYADILVRNINKIGFRDFNMPAPLLLPTKMVFGWSKPKIKILGADFSGIVAAVGGAVKRFKIGDAVFGYIGQTMGANAEFICVKENSIIEHKPQNLPHEEAVMLPYGATMAIPILKKANIQSGQRVLINGASGGIGSVALQIAKNAGAEVTGVCGTNRIDFVKKLGADHVIDYKNEDITQSKIRYDVILDIYGKLPFKAAKNILTEKGILLYVSFKIPHLWQMLMTSFSDGRKVICALSDESPNHLKLVRDLAESGDMTAAVDRTFPLEQAAEAHRYLESGKKQGNVVLKIA
jgi:NADPH:quinone reductase-like Zn-dependent oxidoreductase